MFTAHQSYFNQLHFLVPQNWDLFYFFTQICVKKKMSCQMSWNALNFMITLSFTLGKDLQYGPTLTVFTVPKSDSEIFDKYRPWSNLKVSAETVGVKL